MFGANQRTIEDKIAEQDDDAPTSGFPYSAMGDDIPDDVTPQQAMHRRREESVHEAEMEDIERRQNGGGRQ